MTENIVEFAIVIIVALTLIVTYLAIRRQTITDLLLTVDLITTKLIAIIVLIAVIDGDTLFFDIAIAVGALAFIATLAIARYVIERKVI